jgi:hypothetical protein
MMENEKMTGNRRASFGPAMRVTFDDASGWRSNYASLPAPPVAEGLIAVPRVTAATAAGTAENVGLPNSRSLPRPYPWPAPPIRSKTVLPQPVVDDAGERGVNLGNGIEEISRHPNRGAYFLLHDATTDEFVLFNMPVTSPTSGAPPGWKRDDDSDLGIYANPDGGSNEKWSPPGTVPKAQQADAAVAGRLFGGRERGLPSLVARPDSYVEPPPEQRPRGTTDAAFHARALRLINAERVRGINDANRRFFGQAPISGKPGLGPV